MNNQNPNKNQSQNKNQNKNQNPAASGPKRPGKIAKWCYVLANLIFSYQIMISLIMMMVGYSGSILARIPILSNTLVPPVLVIAAILMCVNDKLPVYNRSAGAFLFAVAAVCYVIPFILLNVFHMPVVGSGFLNTARYISLAFGYVCIFMDAQKLKTYVIATLALPCIFSAATIMVDFLAGLRPGGLSLGILIAAGWFANYSSEHIELFSGGQKLLNQKGVLCLIAVAAALVAVGVANPSQWMSNMREDSAKRAHERRVEDAVDELYKKGSDGLWYLR